MKQQIVFQRIEGLSIFVVATILYFFLGFSWLLYILLLFIFDVFMVGYLFNKKIGAYLYNIGHSLIIPSLLAVIGITTTNNILVGLSLLWLAHIGLDRMLGFGLKSIKGFKHTHLGIINNKTTDK